MDLRGNPDSTDELKSQASTNVCRPQSSGPPRTLWESSIVSAFLKSQHIAIIIVHVKKSCVCASFVLRFLLQNSYWICWRWNILFSPTLDLRISSTSDDGHKIVPLYFSIIFSNCFHTNMQLPLILYLFCYNMFSLCIVFQCTLIHAIL